MTDTTNFQIPRADLNTAADIEASVNPALDKIDAVAYTHRRSVGEYKYAVDAASHDSIGGGLFSWVLCDGSELAAGYTALIAKLAGNPFGVGGAGRPKVPDLRGRVPVHPDGSAGRITASDALGGAGGHSVTPLPDINVQAYSSGAARDVYDASVTEPADNNMQPYIVAGSWFIKT